MTEDSRLLMDLLCFPYHKQVKRQKKNDDWHNFLAATCKDVVQATKENKRKTRPFKKDTFSLLPSGTMNDFGLCPQFDKLILIKCGQCKKLVKPPFLKGHHVKTQHSFPPETRHYRRGKKSKKKECRCRRVDKSKFKVQSEFPELELPVSILDLAFKGSRFNPCLSTFSPLVSFKTKVKKGTLLSLKHRIPMEMRKVRKSFEVPEAEALKEKQQEEKDRN